MAADFQPQCPKPAQKKCIEENMTRKERIRKKILCGQRTKRGKMGKLPMRYANKTVLNKPPMNIKNGFWEQATHECKMVFPTAEKRFCADSPTKTGRTAGRATGGRTVTRRRDTIFRQSEKKGDTTGVNIRHRQRTKDSDFERDYSRTKSGTFTEMGFFPKMRTKNRRVFRQPKN